MLAYSAYKGYKNHKDKKSHEQLNAANEAHGADLPPPPQQYAPPQQQQQQYAPPQQQYGTASNYAHQAPQHSSEPQPSYVTSMTCPFKDKSQEIGADGGF